MTITHVKLSNFQSHADSTFKLSPRVTSIVGRSDAGKSSILRAIRWVAMNAPSGDEFVRHGEDSCEVVLKLASGDKIGRFRGKKENGYSLNEAVFKSFGAGVPEPVAEILNICPTNFQTQIEPPFWFTEGAGQVSRNLNAIVNLGDIDKAVAKVSQEVRKANSLEEVSRERLREAEEVVKATERAIELDKKLVKLEAAAGKWQKALSEAKRLETLIESLEEAEESHRENAEVGKLCDRVTECWDKLEKLTEDRRHLEKILHTAFQSVTPEPDFDLDAMSGLLSEYQVKTAEASALEDLLNEFRETEEAVCLAEKAATEAESGIEALVGQKCPLCGRSGKPSH